MAVIVTRAGKGSPLTNNEVDANFINLNTELGLKASAGANSDITSLAGITGGISTADYVQFDTTPETVPTAPGSLYWDSADGNQTLSLVMAGNQATQQIGEELYFRVKASAAITNGQAVMFTGTVGASGALTAAPATGLAASTASYVMGIATQDIALNGWGYITNFGLVREVNTSAWAAGTILYYDPTVTGGLTSTIPAAPNAKVQVCAVVYQHASNGSLFVRPSFGGTLGQYEGDVAIASPATNHILQYSASGYWTNVAPATARTNLGLAIGTNVQAWDTHLDQIAALTPTTDNFIVGNGTAWALETPAQARTSLGLTIGTDVQAYDADLGAIAALAGTSGFLKKTAANTWSLDTSTYLTTAVTSVGGTGTVSGLSLSGTVTTTGNLTLSGTLAVTASNFSSQTANTFLAAPNGAAGVPTFRALVAADVPTLNQNTTGTAANVTGTVAIANGGTGATSAGTALTNLGAQATLVSGTSIKTVNGNSLLGAGNLSVSASPGGSDTQVQYNSAGAFAGSANLTFNGTNLTCGGTVTANSDESLKTNWRDLPTDFIEQLAQVKHGTYDRLDIDMTQDGVSAQSLQPLLVNSVLRGEDGKLSVAYGNAALVSAIQLAKRLVALEATVAKLVD